jgi:hypothetical protein
LNSLEPLRGYNQVAWGLTLSTKKKQMIAQGIEYGAWAKKHATLALNYYSADDIFPSERIA